ncbi:hypothetical protein PT974_03492 [Cladobotryum mycophilum]|uniref:Uncharacterized protein n=1 Tax=Cladobotryum mycophilum TaxID=491253 RepID=A0ABR0SSK9_9HYPO
MAASPGHPFFLLPIESARAEIQKSRRLFHSLWYEYPSAEQLTGPIALRQSIFRYNSYRDVVDKVDLLPSHLIYPFNWNTDENIRSICSAEQDTFNESHCKKMLKVHERASISITYWSHTHRGKGPDVENIARISE